MSRPLVSVLTGTWQRHELLTEAVGNVRRQTYPSLEHVCVCDGPDPGFVRAMVDGRARRTASGQPIPVRHLELGHHWSGFLAASSAAVPFQVAQWLARGEYLCWLTDDDRMDPTYIARLVALLEETQSDFVSSLCRVWHKEDDPNGGDIVGADPPEVGNVTNVLYRRELLDYRGFRDHVGSGSDHDQVLEWVRCGARYAMLDEVLFVHRADKSGEGEDYRPLRQPLRGQTSERQRAL